MPFLQSSISPAINLSVAMDRTTTVRASVKDIETTLIISVILVILVVFAFLRTVRATIIPSIAVPLSLVGTFGGMYLLGYSLDNLSLMALAISTGFVVDDAIVVLENITRYVEQGMDVVQAAFKGRGRNWIYSHFDEHIAGGRVHSAADDGRNRRTPLPRICGDAQYCDRGFPGGFTDHNPDDVREVPAALEGRKAQCLLPSQ